MTNKAISTWVALIQALRAIEAVSHSWAQHLELEPGDILLILLLAEGEGTPTTLGHRVGRWRQQVHRSLERLEQKGIVEAAQFSRRGKVLSWKLAPKGCLSLAGIRRRMEIWEGLLVGRVNTDVLTSELHATLRTLVNRTMEGYFAGLYAPDELQRDPKLEFLKEKLALREAAPEPGELPGTQRRRFAAELAAQAEREDLESLHEAWQSLWR
jgi:hypothetical protein